jgi:diacylglycerol O-acyltransferase-1
MASSSPPVSSSVSSSFSPSILRPSDPLHLSVHPSLLSSESSSQDFRGLLNLGAIILIAMNTRLVVENFLKYGFLIRLHSSEALTTNLDKSLAPLLALAAILSINPVIGLAIEKLASSRSIGFSSANFLHLFNCLFVFVIPQLTVIRSSSSFLIGMIVEFATIIMTMKLVSFAHVSDDIRRIKADYEKSKKSDAKPSTSSEHHNHSEIMDYQPTFGHLLYFLAAPTLIYQVSYPRSPRIRKRFVARRSLELIFCLSLQLFIIEQYIFPLVRNSLTHFDNRNLIGIFERVLKLAIPITIHWLLMFYGFFHAFLNLTAELLRFGDRLFYADWYNSATLDGYWRKWNLPVHHFVVRHVYFPCLRAGLTPIQSQLVVFALSAIGHELLVSIPAHLIQFHAFFAMLFQLPLIWFTKIVVKSTKAGWIGNCTFWITFLIFGQPMIVLLYATEYLRSN